ncbi:hypothetical protein [Kibdelosporangium philippinense]|uniref:hypothetical protein n=1 Tax=Kibdelosporangium philippinense TaxID=211113 RepID=UPI003610BA0C
MRQAIELAAALGSEKVDEAMGLAAIAGRFADDDLPSIVDHLAGPGPQSSCSDSACWRSPWPGSLASCIGGWPVRVARVKPLRRPAVERPGSDVTHKAPRRLRAHVSGVASNGR